MLLDRGWEGSPSCDCRTAFESTGVATPGGPTPLVVDALVDPDADVVRTRTPGLERLYDGDAAALLVADGRFAERVGFHDSSLADCARRDPLAAAREAVGRAGPVARIAAETGLAAGEQRGDYDAVLRAHVEPAMSSSRVDPRPPIGGELIESRDLDTGAVVRIYRDCDRRRYHLWPAGTRLDAGALATLEATHELLADGAVGGGDRAPGRPPGGYRRKARRDAGCGPGQTQAWPRDSR